MGRGERGGCVRRGGRAKESGSERGSEARPKTRQERDMERGQEDRRERGGWVENEKKNYAKRLSRIC